DVFEFFFLTFWRVITIARERGGGVSEVLEGKKSKKFFFSSNITMILIPFDTPDNGDSRPIQIFCLNLNSRLLKIKYMKIEILVPSDREKSGHSQDHFC